MAQNDRSQWGNDLSHQPRESTRWIQTPPLEASKGLKHPSLNASSPPMPRSRPAIPPAVELVLSPSLAHGKGNLGINRGFLCKEWRDEGKGRGFSFSLFSGIKCKPLFYFQSPLRSSSNIFTFSDATGWPSGSTTGFLVGEGFDLIVAGCSALHPKYRCSALTCLDTGIIPFPVSFFFLFFRTNLVPLSPIFPIPPARFLGKM